MIEIYALRHAPVKAKGLCYGQIDVETSLSYEDSLDQLQNTFVNVPPFDNIWTSPLLRCRMLANAYNKPYQIDARLMEISFGDWEGLTWGEIYEQFPAEMDAWGANWSEVAPPNGESAKMLELRVREWLKSISPGRHLVFTHAGVIRALRVVSKTHSWQNVVESSVPYLMVERFSYLPISLT